MSGDQKLSNHHPSILHIENTAGGACTIAKWTNKIYQVHTDVYSSLRHDRFGHFTYGTKWVQVAPKFFPFLIKNIENFDVVHLHSRDRFINKIRKYYPRKPLIMHYHGTDIRGRWNGRRRFWEKADAIIVSTINLLDGAPPETTYLPNPIDTDLFYSLPNKEESNLALTFNHGANDVATKLAKRYGLKLTIHPRNKLFSEMPSFFMQFSWYIDTKRNKLGELLCRSGDSGSKTGLEALACGLKVINSDGEIREKLPSEHMAENVVRTLHQIYVSLVE